MFGLEMLDVLIGLITVYLSCGLACTALVEAITSWGSVRSRNLEDALKEFMAGDISDNKKFIAAFFDHPLIQALSKGRDGRPSYIPKETVAQVIQSLVLAGRSAGQLSAAVAAMPDLPGQNRIKVILTSCVQDAATNVDEFRKMVELHFDASMQRASGWFKRYAQNITILISMVMVFGANIDSLEIASSLSSSPEIRLKMVAVASAQLEEASEQEAAARSTSAIAAAEQSVTESDGQASGPGENQAAAAEPAAAGKSLQIAMEKSKHAAQALDAARQNLSANALAFGWSEQKTPSTFTGWLKKLVGLLMSGFAISLGAPFWFDILKMFMNVRSSVAVPLPPATPVAASPPPPPAATATEKPKPAATRAKPKDSEA